MSYKDKIADDALVLEIGSGSSPWERSDVLLDRFYVDDTGQRGGNDLYLDQRPMIVASGEKLPFRDKSFDFIYCNHVIEHALDIGAMLDEMSRVAKAGYLECPNPALEKILDQDQHNWYISEQRGKLLIIKKDVNNNVTTKYDKFYFNLLSDHFIVRNYWKHFVTRLDWKDHIPYEYVETADEMMKIHELPDIREEINLRLTSVLFKAYKDAIRDKLKSKIRKSALNKPVTSLYSSVKGHRNRNPKIRITHERLSTILVCPYCKQRLEKGENNYQCNSCQKKFSIQGNIPILL